MVVEPWPEDERLAYEKMTLGLYLTGHPIGPYESEIQHFVTARLGKLSLDNERGATGRREMRVVVAGLVVELRTRQNKNGKRMAFATLDDRTGRLEVAVFSEVLEKYREHLVKDTLLVVEGNLSFDDYAGQLRLTAENLFTMAEARAHFAKHLFIQWPSAGTSTDRPSDQWVNELVDLLTPFRGGSCPIYIEYRGKAAQTTIQLGESWRVHPGDELIARLQKRVGADKVKLHYQ
jgi:DNA polymerase-3 subunit alpha